MNDESRDNLTWAAFRYVAAELSAADCQAFETRLADDPAAAEEVARAVELVHAVRAAGLAATVDVKPRRSSPRRRWRVARWTLALTACAAVVAVVCLSAWWLPQRGDRSLTAETPVDRTLSAELAIAWSDARDELTDPAKSEGSFAASASETAEPAFGVAEGEAELVTPDWMFAAVIDLEGEASSENAPDAEDI
jgi:anti-sigma factor RsiW